MAKQGVLSNEELEAEIENAAEEIEAFRQNGDDSDNEESDSEPFGYSSGSEYDPKENQGTSVDESSSNSEEDESQAPQDITNDEYQSDDWTDSEEPIDIEHFSGQEGIKVDYTLPLTPYDTFSWLFDETLLQKIVNWTNIRATRCKNNPNLGKKSNMRRWTDTNLAEIKKFLGLCLLMGNVQMPFLRNYWNKDLLYYHPIFGKTMGRNRFEMLLRNICFYAPDDNKESRMHKVSNLTIHIRENIEKVYYPSEHLSLDEALLLWKGRLIFRQYIPNKRHKYGIKFYEISTHDGFVLDLLIYSGKQTVSNENGHAFEVVKTLTEKYFGKGHTLYMDNFYCSYKLAKYLLEKKTYLCGTLRKNRKGNPPAVISEKLKKSERKMNRKGKIRVLKWKDKRDVLMISSKHGSEMIEVTSRKGTKKFKPVMVAEYNKYMSGIDRADQMTSYYSTPRKTLRWYMKVFFHLLDICLWNGNWLFNKATNMKYSYLRYRDNVIKSLLDLPTTSHISNIRDQSQSRVSREKTHFPKKENKRKRCRSCSENKKRSVTWYTCTECKDKNGAPIGLCADPCFATWHKQENIK